MPEKVKAPERERRDWTIILIILLLGFLCVILAGEQALRFSPNWQLNTSMDSNINPDSIFLTSRPNNFFEPLDSSILTPPAWLDVFLTPGAIVNTRPPASTSTPISTVPKNPLETNTSLPINTSLPTNTIVPTITALPTNTPFIIIVNPTKTSPPVPPDTSTPVPPNTSTPIPQPVADLSITITDSSSDYVANAYKLLPNTPPYAYVITVTNAGPSNVSGVTVSNTFTDGTTGAYVNIVPSTVGWVCVPSAGATCLSLLGGSNLSNQSVDLNSGASVTFYLAAQVVSNPSGPLINTVTVIAPAGVSDPNPSNNSTSDTDQLVIVDPPGNIGTTPDGITYDIPAGTYITLELPLVVNGHPSWDLVYYELPQSPGIAMDAVILQVGDGSNWYTILNWGDGNPDTNTNISIPLPSPNPTDCTGEPDNCPIDASLLYASTGVLINVDGVVPNGTYPYIRIFSPPTGSPPTPSAPDTDGRIEVDAISILP